MEFFFFWGGGGGLLLHLDSEILVNVDNSSASSFGILDTYDFRKCWFCYKECGFNVSKHFVRTKNHENV